MVQKSGDHHLVSVKLYEKWDVVHINWCRIPSIKGINKGFSCVEFTHRKRCFASGLAATWRVLDTQQFSHGCWLMIG